MAKKKNTTYKQKILLTNRNRTRNDRHLQKFSEKDIKAAVINLMNMLNDVKENMSTISRETEDMKIFKWVFWIKKIQNLK